MTRALQQRYSTPEEVPIFAFPVVAADHPDLEVIKEAYKRAGQGLGVDYAAPRDEARLPEYDDTLECSEHPSAQIHTSFGLAGGGYGVYSVCEECGTILSKTCEEMDE